MPAAGDTPFPDFSNDIEFTNWFRRHAWTGVPNEWDLATVELIQEESFRMRSELDRRMEAASGNRTDEALFWSSFAIGVAGGVLLLFPPAAIPVLLTTSLTVSGLGGTVVSKARSETLANARAQIKERSRDLNDLQRALLARKRELNKS
jgi:hypothetical protein